MKTRVWDLPTRLFHWALAACVIGLVVTSKIGGHAMAWHFRLGYAVLALLLFRLVWGMVGGHWSRFGSFLYGPGTIVRYLRGQGEARHRVGHNPLGSLSVFGLLAVLAAQAGTGLFADDEIANMGPLARFVSTELSLRLTWYHKVVGEPLVLGWVALHLLAIVFHAVVKRERLVVPMITGDKELALPAPGSADTATSRLLGLCILIVCAGAVAWLVSL
ncbi:cytochrome b/b6 domain-containing protein [Schlegelella sp. S2-27]|uniref:Cytochrome b/b6 domain-containing protein n=1 Tax=Caldimonas mangrovi TaxID=2944811 RepID=A0ABT0YSI0_9BURK|nr:cytochrome b/b6 domain-containing protein [Caldimonas mangrovi]MCM5681685.1 cytochrome b/b6 domain-containing protein [Caldimonas mangrovi]